MVFFGILAGIELIRDVMIVFVTCKFDEDPIKNEVTILRTTFSPLDQLAKPTFRSRYAHTLFVTEQSEGPMDTVVSVSPL